MGFERSEQNNPVSCFVNGDRRFLPDITKDKIRNVGQKSRTNPSLVKRLGEKYDYMKGSEYLFNMVPMQKDQYTTSFDDINYDIYRVELIGIVAAYNSKRATPR